MQTKIIDHIEDPLKNNQGIFYFRVFAVILLLGFGKLAAQPVIEIAEAKKNFDYVKRGEKVVMNYEVKNTGNEPLLINKAEVACSCTSVEFPQSPILPNETKQITVTFNTTTVYGRQDRVVLLHSNSKTSPDKLRFKGTVSKE